MNYYVWIYFMKIFMNDYMFCSRYRNCYISDVFSVHYVLHSDSGLGSILHVCQCGDGDTVGFLFQYLEHIQVFLSIFLMRRRFFNILSLIKIFSNETRRIYRMINTYDRFGIIVFNMF